MRDKLTALRETRHSTRERLSVVAVVLLISLSLVSGLAVAQTGNDILQCDQGPPIPDQQEGSGTGGIEIVMANDKTNSMDSDEIGAAENGSISVVDELEQDDEAAAVSFAGEHTTLDQELTTDHQAVRDGIRDGLSEQFTTPAGEVGIETSHEELTNGSNASQNAIKVIVLFSDAPDMGPGAQDAAQAAKDDGIRIFAIALGDVNEDEYESLASSPVDAYFAPTEEDLAGIYDEISQDVEDIESAQLTIETRSLFQPGETHGYTVMNETVSPDGTTTTEYVTAGASINTSDESVLSVDESSAELTATDDPEVSEGVVITAEHNGVEGCLNAIVATESVENLDILPPVWRITAFLGDWTVFLIFISSMAGVIGTRIATSFMGLSLMELVLMIGWFGGYISTGLVMVSVCMALFVGLNLAANIDYSVRR